MSCGWLKRVSDSAQVCQYDALFFRDIKRQIGSFIVLQIILEYWNRTNNSALES